ncbi:MAG: hypothetical protein ACPGWR_12230 [Ardenticatenaceae bacterium]
MDPVTTAIVTAIVAGAAGGMAEVSLVEGYTALKSMFARRFGDQSEIVRAVESVEMRPSSTNRQGILAEEVQAAGADKDVEVLQVVTRLLEAIQNMALRQAQGAAVGVDLEKIKAATLKIEDIIATGTGIRVKDGEFSGDISIKGVRAGRQSASIPKS